MMVTFVSQCEKKAHNRTRRVLDAFANRIGDNTWQTVITAEGLLAVKKLLRKTASKNTAVSCFWIRTRSRSELVWVVGNRSKFNSEGVVPVNSTEQERFISEGEKNPYYEVIGLASAIAGLFHDFGKANPLFQNKLDKNHKGKKIEPYRHEWLSLRLFQAFVKGKSDIEWLQNLRDVDNHTENFVLKNLIRDGIDDETGKIFDNLAPLAKLVAWLVVSHHRLPVYPSSNEFTNDPQYQNIDSWLNNEFDVLWNATNHCGDFSQQDIKTNWVLKKRTPFNSALWQVEASELAKQALLLQKVTDDLFNQRFIAHISRMCLMLSDHYYSAGPAKTKSQDRNYEYWANTDEHKNYKQKLDEHNIGVAINAKRLVSGLPKLKDNLPTIKLTKKFTKANFKTEKEQQLFGWQEDSYQLAKKLRKETSNHGFFGVNMASTGKGKTIANARIMAGLSEKDKCRFSVALGLRTLTLQTGKALANMLDLKKENYGILIGSQAVQALFQNQQDKESDNFNGSESSQDLSKDQDVIYDGIVDNEILTKWLEKSPKMQKLINAPLLVSTIDHLIPATEGVRGGKQIAPMLRLFTSDLVLDEPDDFGLDDLPALCRLVNWAAMLGSKVLLSTATMPPALVMALFQAYQQGWKTYTEVNNKEGMEDKICCAWFDEFSTQKYMINDGFGTKHNEFIKTRIESLSNDEVILRKAVFLDINVEKPSDVITVMADKISQSAHELHDKHQQVNEVGKSVSIGLVKIANINPLVELSKTLIKISPKENYRIHYCVYHSNFPLALRHHIESKLDTVLNRYDEQAIWQQDEIKQALKQTEKHHIFIVLATSVAEVGRDHDYDWAITEPSSMRSLIQIAGRIQRHRKKSPAENNFLIFTKNINALLGKEFPYGKSVSGFEVKEAYGNKERKLNDNDLRKVLDEKHLEKINSIPRIKFSGKLKNDSDRKQGKYCDFIEMEHWALSQRLLGVDEEQENAKYWWENDPSWCAEIQKRQPFRKSQQDENYALCIKEYDEIIWCLQDVKNNHYIYPPAGNFNDVENLQFSQGNQAWFDLDELNIYEGMANDFAYSKKGISEKFGQLRLRVNKDKVIQWSYHHFLGVFNEK